MAFSIATFNVNNLYARYRFGRTFRATARGRA